MMIRVTGGNNGIEVPVFDIVGKRPGKTLLVTAGMDGDEYAGIDACYRVIDRITASDIAGRLIIIPVVNTPGFWAETSSNPIDQKFLKFSGVGKANGSASERLVHWLVDTYVKSSDLWLDLHGGTRTETIATYLWAWETKVATIDRFVRKFIIDHTPQFGIFEHQLIPIGKAATLARMGCAYIQGEAGGSGRRLEKDIRQHEMWIAAAIAVMGQSESVTSSVTRLSKNVSTRDKMMIYDSVAYLRCRKLGLWYPSDTTIRIAKKGDTLGVVRLLDGKQEEVIRAPHAGQLLWIKDGLRALPTDGLVAIGYKK